LIKIKKYLDTSNLPKNGKHINWKKSVGKELDFIYDDIIGKITIEDYKDGVLTIKYKNEKTNINIKKIKQCQFGELLHKRTKEFKYEIGQNFIDDKRNFTITNRELRPDKSSDKKIKKYQYKCNICGFDCGVHYKGGIRYDEFWTKETAITRGVGCACCKNEITVDGINDISTTNPWMIPYFQNGIEEAKKYNSSSNKKIIPICPNCNKISDHKVMIEDIYANKGFGCICSDGFSIPEKFMYVVLIKLDQSFIFHASKKDIKWCNNYQYDFYLPTSNCIIETHGMQHYNGKQMFNNNNRNEKEIDQIKRDLALKNNIKHYIEIDCRYSTSEWLINHIKSSELSSLFDLSKINWDDCMNFANNSFSKSIIDYINKYEWLKQKDLCSKFNVSKPYIYKLIRSALYDGRINKDEYDNHKTKLYKEMGKSRSKKILVFDGNNNFLDKYESAGLLIKDSYEKFGCEFTREGISSVCRNEQHTHRGYIFKYE
jgi:hypothetical protein